MSRQRLRLVWILGSTVYRDHEVVQPIALHCLLSSQLVTAFIFDLLLCLRLLKFRCGEG